MKLSEPKKSYISTKNKLDKLSRLAAQNQQMKDYLHHIEEINLKLKSYIEKINSSKAYKLWQKTDLLINKPSKLFNQIKIASEFARWNKTKTADKFNILIFGVINYDFRYQRPQHLADELAKKGHRVFYIEPNFVNSPEEKPVLKPHIEKIKTNLYKVKLASATNSTMKMFVYYGEILKEDRLSLVQSVRYLLKKASISKAVIKVDNPSWTFIVDKFNLPIVYDCIDDHGAFETRADNIVSSENSLIRKSDAVLFSSHGLANKKNKDKRRNTYVIENAGEYNHFANSRKDPLFRSQLKLTNSPILGYCGAVSEWFDSKLLGIIASSFPDYQIVIVGRPDYHKVRETADKFQNIHLLGEKKYEELPQIYETFSVCLIPFLINDVTRNLNPVKIYEYLATGKPIVTTNIPGLQQFGNLIYMSKNESEFCKNIQRAISEADVKISQKRRLFAKKNDWKERATHLESIIKNLK